MFFCSSSFQSGMSHNGKSFANTRALEVPEISKFHKTPSPGDVIARSSEKRPSSCQSCSPRSHIWKNRLRSRLCRMSHMIGWQCSLCKLLPSSVPCGTHSSDFLFVCLFALVLAPAMQSPAGVPAHIFTCIEEMTLKNGGIAFQKALRDFSAGKGARLERGR